VKVTWPLRAALQAPQGATAAAPRPAAPAPGDADFATALGLDPAALEPLELELDGEEAAAAGLVRFHFLANRPRPAAFPRVALRLLDLVLDEEVDAGELCRLVELDLAVAGAVLARANAAAGRALDPIETVRQAVTRIGLSEVARVAAATAMRTLYDGQAQRGFGTHAPVWPILFEHALVTGRLAGELARGRRDARPELAFMAGLLHDVGLAVGMRSLASLTGDGTLAPREPTSAIRLLLRDHVELGVEAVRAWGLPPRLVEAVHHHHRPGLAAGPEQTTLQIVRVASALHLLDAAPGASPAAAREAVEGARALGGSPAWIAAAVARREDAAAWARRCFAQL
jgi:putative nucleotidyltransferase with HDIG domain